MCNAHKIGATHMMSPSLASTVVLVREQAQTSGTSGLETLLLLRNSKLVFEGGAWVFPGGRVDDCDYPPDRADLPASHVEYLAAIKAAVRETEEEAGICISPGELIHIAHWTTPQGMSRRFATWFFLCPLNEAVDIVVDQQEIHDYQWIRPDLALARHASGEIRLPPPTAHTLQSIAGFKSLKSLCHAMSTADIHVFPEDSAHYRPVEGICSIR